MNDENKKQKKKTTQGQIEFHLKEINKRKQWITSIFNELEKLNNVLDKFENDTLDKEEAQSIFTDMDVYTFKDDQDFWDTFEEILREEILKTWKYIARLRVDIINHYEKLLEYKDTK